MYKYTREEDNVWKTEIKFIEAEIDIPIYVPEKVLKILHAIDKKINKNSYELEFSVYFKANIGENITITEEYFIPEQEVSYAYIDYKEAPPQEFNTVVHRHPPGLKDFSNTDMEYINKNTAVSLLYVDNQIPVATVKIKIDIPNHFLLAKTRKIIVIEDNPEIEIKGIEKIKERTLIPKNYTYKHINKKNPKKTKSPYYYSDYTDYKPYPYHYYNQYSEYSNYEIYPIDLSELTPEEIERFEMLTTEEKRIAMQCAKCKERECYECPILSEKTKIEKKITEEFDDNIGDLI